MTLPGSVGCNNSLFSLQVRCKEAYSKRNLISSFALLSNATHNKTHAISTAFIASSISWLERKAPSGFPTLQNVILYFVRDLFPVILFQTLY